MQLDGYLSSFSLPELLELCVASLVNGAIEIHAPAGMYRLFFCEGALVHATSPDASGFEAFWPLFELGEARFRFVAGATPHERTITEPTRPLIAQAAALAQQWSTIRPQVPHLGIVPEMVSPANAEHVRIYEEDWPILSAIDGVRSIAEVARRAQLDRIQVCVGLLRLKERGLIRFAEARAVVENALTIEPEPAAPPVSVLPQPPAPSSAVPQRATPGVGFFARLLVNVPDEALPPPLDVAPALAALPAAPLEYDDILVVLRS